MRVFVFLGIILTSFFACKQDPQHHKIPIDNPTAEEIQLYNDCIKIHDEVMPQMGELEELRQLLKERKGKDLAAITKEEAIVINSALAGLNKSEGIMFDWMARFKEVENLERDQVLPYLESMKSKAENMSQLFKDSFVEAKQLLNN